VKTKLHKGTLTITGTNGNDTIVLRLGTGGPTDLEVDVGGDDTADASFDRADFDHIVVEAKKGDDTVMIDGVNGQFTDTEVTTLDGGDGNDTLVGGSGGEAFLGGDGNDTLHGGPSNDTFSGGDGNDFVDGDPGSDTAMLGEGDDTFQWDPGDGSDIVNGDDGHDRMLFNGANLAEKFDISATGARVRFTRDIGNIVMDLGGVEAIDLNSLGGADRLTVDDVSGTDLTEVNDDLGANDGAPDDVIVNGTGGDDVITVAGDSSGVSVLGLAARINITNAEPTDALTVNALAGDDAVTATGLTADALTLIEDGGDGNDVLLGGDGDDTLLGGAGDDALIGGPRMDTLDGGPGSNTEIQ
jgi:Ca2+-binding RTX toxin-like protein